MGIEALSALVAVDEKEASVDGLDAGLVPA